MNAAPTVAETLAEAARALKAVTETPRLDAEILLAHAAGLSRSKLLARLRDTLDVPRFDSMLRRRLDSEPIAYILGEWEFFGLAFFMRQPILVPRPETEHLVEAAIEHLRSVSGAARILDIGTGTGCVAVSIAKNSPGAGVLATDINPDTIALAHENAERHGVSVDFRQGDLYAALAASDGPFDVIVSNPPYVETDEWPQLPDVIRRYEDPHAILAGADGLDILRRIIEGAPRFLKPGGLLAVEMGEKHNEAVRDLFGGAGFWKIRTIIDLAGIPRVVHGIRPFQKPSPSELSGELVLDSPNGAVT